MGSFWRITLKDFWTENHVMVLFGLSLIIAIAASCAFSVWQVTISDRQWCTALQTLTATPVPRPSDPAANPSRVEAWRLYSEFMRLRGEFGCG